MMDQLKTILTILAYVAYLVGKMNGWFTVPPDMEQEINYLFWAGIVFWIKVGLNRMESQSNGLWMKRR